MGSSMTEQFAQSAKMRSRNKIRSILETVLAVLSVVDGFTLNALAFRKSGLVIYLWTVNNAVFNVLTYPREFQKVAGKGEVKRTNLSLEGCVDHTTQ